jgi:predicted DNA-binding protein with PD1-like motif
MNAKVLHAGGARTIALVFDAGEEPMQGLLDFATREGLSAGHFTAIGAFQNATLGYFDWTRKDYTRIAIDEQVEVLSLVGDVALEGSAPKVHAHVVVGKRDGTAHGGHLLAARVRPTLEVILIQPPGHLRRRYDPASRLALIDLENTASTREERSMPERRHLRGVGSKEQRQYEHIKEAAQREGRYGGRAAEVAARTVMKQHSKKGHRKGQ